MVPLGTAMVVGFRTVFGIQERLANTADVQKLSTYFPSDVASVDSDGVNPVTGRRRGHLQGVGRPSSRSSRSAGTRTSATTARRSCGTSLAVPASTASSCAGSAGIELPAASDGREQSRRRRSALRRVRGRRRRRLPQPRRRRRPADPGLRHCASASSTSTARTTSTSTRSAASRVTTAATDRPVRRPTSTRSAATTACGCSGPPRWTPVVSRSPATTSSRTGDVVGGTSPDVLPGRRRQLRRTDRRPDQLPELPLPGPGRDGRRQRSVVRRTRTSVTPGPTTPEPPTARLRRGRPVDERPDQRDLEPPVGLQRRRIGAHRVPSSRRERPDVDADRSSPTPNPATFSGAVTGLDNNTRYTVQVSALNSYGEGSPSPSIAGRAHPAREAGRRRPRPAAGTAGTVVLTFTPPSGGAVRGPHELPGEGRDRPPQHPGRCRDRVPDRDIVHADGERRQRELAARRVTVQAQNATGWGPLSDSLTIPADTTPPTVGGHVPVQPAVRRDRRGTPGCGDAGRRGLRHGVRQRPRCRRERDDDGPARERQPVLERIAGTSSTSGQPWYSSSAATSPRPAPRSWSRALTTASLQNGVTYTIIVVAKDTRQPPSTTVTRTFAYVTGAPDRFLTAPANGARGARHRSP